MKQFTDFEEHLQCTLSRSLKKLKSCNDLLSKIRAGHEKKIFPCRGKGRFAL